MSRLRMGWVLLSLALVFAPVFSTVHAATVNVTTTDDEDNGNPAPSGSDKAPKSKGCSLREALQEIDNNDGVAYHGCSAATVNGPNTVNLSGAGGTITINGLVPDPNDHTNGTNKVRNGQLPNIFTAATIGKVIITGGDVTCDAAPNSEKIFIIAADGDLTLTAMTIHDCASSGAGIAVTTQGGVANLTITGSHISNIMSTNGADGGAISHTGGNLTVGSSFFTGNSSSDGGTNGQGGAISVNGVSFPNFVTIDSTAFGLNSAAENGGAIYISTVDGITISNDIFTGNTAGGDSSNNAQDGGGAIWATGAGKGGDSGATNFFLIFNTQFISNSATNGTGGAIVLNSGDLSFGNYDFTDPKIPGGIVASNFTGNSAKGAAPTGNDQRSGSGGAIFAAGNLSVLQSSFVSTIGGANSSAHGSGGAIAFNDAGGSLNPLAIVNSTFSGNTADQNGGAIANLLAMTNQSGKLMLLNDTIDNNPASGTGGTVGGAFFNANDTATDVTVSNTALTDTTAAGGNCSGQPFSGVTDLQFPGTTCGATVPTGDPKLNGPSILSGPNLFVFTMSLNPGSAASNAGTNSVCNAIPVFTFDGTGRPVTRPSPNGSNCDIGAYESGNAPVYASAPAPSSTINISALTTTPMTSTVVISNTGTDDLTISNFSTTGGPQITVAGAATPFTIPMGSGTQTLTLTCGNATPGNFSGTLTVAHNAVGSPATYTVNCAVTMPAMPLTITTASPLPDASVATAYSQTFAATGGTPPYTNWAITAGSIPSWATLDPTSGMLTGTPSNTIGSPFSFTVQVTDSAAVKNTKVFSLSVTAPALVITTLSPLPNASVGASYSQTFAATGGAPPYSNWTVVGGTKPSWATLDPTTGTLSGTPSDTSGSPFTFTVQVQDTDTTTTTKVFSLTVSPPPITITTTSPLPTATVGTAYSQTFAAIGGTPPYTNWAITLGTAPSWATLAAGTGALTGTPPNTTGSPFTFTVTVTDSAAATGSKVFALQVVPTAPSITTASPLPQATVNTAYSQTFAATGGTPPYSNWTVISGTLPSWATLNSATGALTGTPSDITGSPFTFTIQVSDSASVLATKNFTLTVQGSTPVTLQEFGVD
jgi:CSLREA domain-containing protein